MKISIITASYNYDKYIRDTIESVIAQSYKDWELIIVDDGSTDNSIAIINEYLKKDNRISLYTHENHKNKGLKDTLLLALQKAQSDWVVFLESDDSITPDYLEKKIQFLNLHTDAKFIINDVNLIGDAEQINKVSKHFSIINKTLKSKTQPIDLSKVQVIKNHIVTFSVVMINKHIIENLDFNSPVKSFLDYYLWSQVLRDYKVYFLDEKLTNWRLHDNSYIHDAIVNYDVDADIDFNIRKKKFLCKGKNKIQNICNFFSLNIYKISCIKKKYIRIHFSKKELFFLGKWYRF